MASIRLILKKFVLTAILLVVILGVSQWFLPYREITHPLFPYVTLEDPEMPYFNRASFLGKFISWYALDGYVGDFLAKNGGTNQPAPKPFGPLGPQDFAQTILHYDSEINLSKMEPFAAEIRQPGDDPLAYNIRTTAQGFRVALDEKTTTFSAKPNDVFRVVTLGDSLTFGFGIDYENTWVSILASHLKANAPRGIRVEVINAGVISYDSALGKQLLEDRILALQPDLVLIGFGFNDYGFNAKYFVGKTTTSPIYRMRFFRWTRWWIDNYFRKHKKLSVATLKSSKEKLGELLGAHSFTPEQFSDHIESMVVLLKEKNIRSVLLNSTIPSRLYLPALKKISEKNNAPLIDFREILFQAAKRKDVESFQPVDGVFQLKIQNAKPGERFFIVGDFFSAVEFGFSEMNDEGRDGDAVKGDGIFSKRLSFLPGTLLSFRFAKHDPEEGRNHWAEEFHGWRVFRRFEVPEQAFLSKVYAFNDLSDQGYRNFALFPYMQEICHPNVRGNAILGPAVATRVLDYLGWSK